MPQIDSRYEEGDVVATDRGRGVVAAVLAEDFEFPQGDDDLAEVSASDDQPAYVVGLTSTDSGDAGSAVYRASDLEASSFPDDDGDGEGGGPAETDSDGSITDVVSESVDALDGLPEGWNRQSVLKYWSSIGGSWEECVDDLTDDEDFDEERAREQCSAMKDEVLRTTRWRNRF